jgi:haloacid dehalogenase-like hydrolase
MSGSMNSDTCDTNPCQYDASPDAALAAVRAHEGPLLVDFDETLYLSNSTEDFLDCAGPGLLALLLLRVLDVLKPWRLTGGIETRDTWRVCTISIFFPWTHWRWRAKAPLLAERCVNQDLKAALKARAQPPVILTTGFKSVVAPLLAAMAFADAPLSAARMYSFADRRNGKLRMATRALGVEAVGRCLVVTDSVNDLELMQKCARPVRTLWPKARYRPALSGVYLPGEYISKIKRPGQRDIFRGILQQDFAFWLLSSIGLAINPVTHLVGMLLLLLSFWAIYERGYVDNDLAASRYEADPKLSATFGRVQVATPAVQPWIWALLAGAAAVAILHSDETAFAVHFPLWVAVLILVYACFTLYNRLNKMTRVWIYPALQLARSAAFTVIVPIEPAGVAALGAHALSRWVPYQVYRMAPDSWPNIQPELVRLISFVLLSVMIVCSFGLSVLLTWTALALLLWNLFRARRDISAVFNSARRLDRSLAAPKTQHTKRDPALARETAPEHQGLRG